MSPPQQVFDTLAAQFQVYVTKNKQKTLQRVHTWDDLTDLYGRGALHCDLALFSDETCIAPDWTVRDHA